MKSQLLLRLLSVVIAVNGSVEGPDEGHYPDSTNQPELLGNTPFDMLGNRVLNFEDVKEQHEIELRNSVNTTTARSSGDCESNGGECKKNQKQCKDTINRDYTCRRNGVCCIEEPQTTDAPSTTATPSTTTAPITTTPPSITTAQPSRDCESNGGECKKSKKQCKDTITTEYTCSKKGVCCIEEPAETTGCPEGFFALTPSNQCFKFFYNQKSTWFEANSTCQSEGLVMAQPSDPVTLRKYLVNKYGYGTTKGWPYVWLPARGTGSSFQWQPNGGMVYSSNPYWYSYSSSYDSTSYCMYMLNLEYYMKVKPLKPYYYTSCSSRFAYTICELVKE